MTDPGFAPIFKGWNVWDVFAKNDLDFELNSLGLTADRRLRIWVENTIKDGAPAAAVDDQANPSKLVGDMIEILQSPGDLATAVRKESLPAPIVLDGPASKHTVRFFNRGDLTELSWPHSSNFLLDAVYQPTSSSPITSGAPPSSLAGSLSSAAEGAKKTTETVLIVAGVVVGGAVLLWLLTKLPSSRRLAA